MSSDLLALLGLQGLWIYTHCSLHFETSLLWSLGFFSPIRAQVSCYQNICDNMRWVIKDERSVSQEQCYNEVAMTLYEMIWAHVAEVYTWGQRRCTSQVAGVSLLLVFCKFIALLVSKPWKTIFVHTVLFPVTVILLVFPGASTPKSLLEDAVLGAEVLHPVHRILPCHVAWFNLFPKICKIKKLGEG